MIIVFMPHKPVPAGCMLIVINGIKSPRYARDMPEIAARSARDRPEIAARSARDVPEMCPRSARDMSQIAITAGLLLGVTALGKPYFSPASNALMIGACVAMCFNAFVLVLVALSTLDQAA